MPPQAGIGAVLHESRSDWAQLLTSLYLVIAGPGLFSLDARLRRARAWIAGRPVPGAPGPGRRGGERFRSALNPEG